MPIRAATRTVALTLGMALLVGACASDDDEPAGDDATTPTTDVAAPDDSTAEAAGTGDGDGDVTSSTDAPDDPAVVTEGDEDADAPSAEPLAPRELVTALSADALGGRDNQTRGSRRAQRLLVGQLESIAEPAFPARDDGYRQPYDLGTNVVGIIPGSDLADEYVLLGAHYDHIGRDCRGVGAEDDVCNGAADNAAGVAVVMEAARAIAEQSPRRSVVVAFWDGEEDGLVGAQHYLANPVVPLEQTVAYVNWDIQGANLLPALSTTTVAIGAETGGPSLVDTVEEAAASGPLDTLTLSLLFGQGRSDYAVFAGAGVPIVFFTDATNGCYHSVSDDVDHVDFDKLDGQIQTAAALVTDLVATDAVPVFDDAALPTTYDDAVTILGLVETGEPDFDLLGADSQSTIEQLTTDLRAVVDAGPDAYDVEAEGAVIATAAFLIAALAGVPCDATI